MSETGTTDLGAMSDVDLTALISNNSNENNPEQSGKSTQAGNETANETESGMQEPANASAEVPGQPSTETASDADPIESIKAELEELKASLKQTQTDNINLQRLNGHLSNELGVLRNKAKTPPPPLPTEEEFFDRPVEFTKKVVDATLLRENQRKEEEIAANNRSMLETLGVVNHYVPNFSDHIEGIVSILKNEGMSPVQLQAFQHNPVSVLNDPALLVNLAKRAIQNKEIETLRQQLNAAKTGTQQMAANITAAAAATPNISSSSVAQKANTTISTSDLRNMSYDDLKKLSKQLTKKTG